MSDFIWFLIITFIFICLSILFIWIGLQIWIKQKTNLIISNYCDKVSDENKAAYCKRMGIGVIIIGGCLGISGVCSLFLQSVYALIPMTVGLVLGIALLISAIIKYNH